MADAESGAATLTWPNDRPTPQVYDLFADFPQIVADGLEMSMQFAKDPDYATAVGEQAFQVPQQLYNSQTYTDLLDKQTSRLR